MYFVTRTPFTVSAYVVFLFKHGSSPKENSRRYGSVTIFHYAWMEFQNRKHQISAKRSERNGPEQILYSEHSNWHWKVHDPSITGSSTILHERTFDESRPGKISYEIVRYYLNIGLHNDTFFILCTYYGIHKYFYRWNRHIFVINNNLLINTNINYYHCCYLTRTRQQWRGKTIKINTKNNI